MHFYSVQLIIPKKKVSTTRYAHNLLQLANLVIWTTSLDLLGTFQHDIPNSTCHVSQFKCDEMIIQADAVSIL